MAAGLICVPLPHSFGSQPRVQGAFMAGLAEAAVSLRDRGVERLKARWACSIPGIQATSNLLASGTRHTSQRCSADSSCLRPIEHPLLQTHNGPVNPSTAIARQQAGCSKRRGGMLKTLQSLAESRLFEESSERLRCTNLLDLVWR